MIILISNDQFPRKVFWKMKYKRKAPWLKVTFNSRREIIRTCAKVIWQNFKNQQKSYWMIDIKYEQTFQHKMQCKFPNLFVLLKGIDLILYPWSIACIHNLLKSNNKDFAIYSMHYRKFSWKVRLDCV